MQGDLDNVFAVVEISIPDTQTTCAEDCIHTGYSPLCRDVVPFVTIRMHPASIPDTRNTIWSPRSNRIPNAIESGTLLYFASGFLSLELEIGSYTASRRKDDYISNPTNFLAYDKLNDLTTHSQLVRNLSTSIAESKTLSELTDSIKHNFAQRSELQDRNVSSFLRSFPMQPYSLSVYWRTYGFIMSLLLVLLICTPSGVAAGMYKRERQSGIEDVLQTLSVGPFHTTFAWAMASAFIVIILACCIFAFFSFTLEYSSAWLATVPLLICGLSLSLVSILVSEFIESPDAVSIALPMVVFITVLPGALYVDISFDSNRTILAEILICLLPPSGAALALRQLFGLEALRIPANWNYPAIISLMPMYAYVTVLVGDLAIVLIIFRLYFGLKSVSSKRSIEAVLPVNVALDIQTVSKFYGSSCVLSGITFQLLYHDIVVLLGSNGAGKTTLLRILCDLDRKYTGEIKRATGSEPKSRPIGWCPQSDALWEYLSVREHVALVSKLLNTSSVDIFAALDRVGMGTESDKLVRHLSGGMKRRLLLCIALANDPSCACLDEVSTGCDAQTREMVRKEILSRSGKVAIIVSTHHADDIDVLSKRIIHINKQSLIFDSRQQGPLSNNDFEFSTWNDTVRAAATSFFGSIGPAVAAVPQHFRQHSNTEFRSSWIIPAHLLENMTAFLQALDSLGFKSWTLISQNSFKIESDRERSQGTLHLPVNQEGLSFRSPSPRYGWIQEVLVQLFAMLQIRALELLSRMVFFLLFDCIATFMVAFIICYICGNVALPKLRLDSSSNGGFGQILASATVAMKNDESSIGTLIGHNITWINNER